MNDLAVHAKALEQTPKILLYYLRHFRSQITLNRWDIGIEHPQNDAAKHHKPCRLQAMLGGIKIVRHSTAAIQNYTECEGLQLPLEVVRSKMIDTGQALCMAAVLHKNQRPLTIDGAMQHAVFIPCHNDRCFAYAG